MGDVIWDELQSALVVEEDDGDGAVVGVMSKFTVDFETFCVSAFRVFFSDFGREGGGYPHAWLLIGWLRLQSFSLVIVGRDRVLFCELHCADSAED